MIPCILLVENEPDFRFAATVVLQKEGYKVVEASDGEDALVRIREFRNGGERIDLLLTDLRMPFLCGLELIDGMRALGVEIPVIAMTGYCDDALVADLKLKGCTEFMEKPFEPHDLVARVQRVLKGLAIEEEGYEGRNAGG